MRVKRGVTSHNRHHKIRTATKGFSHPNRRSVKLGRQAVVKSLQFAYRDRRNKKRTTRALWNARINAAARANGTTYARLINGLKTSGSDLNRKMLSEIAVYEPSAFTAIVKSVK